ncbi:btb/poz domain-containing [Anaeramoeba flamelloides]|uniref:Btb/poz domain-containing n=1 Tax=Anaeramoeba flamelloides TaxID=1746091 RepID=A0AAV7YK92_9EUKA|nr:btb/poz domain-containing [Anaeramoeba flamelloides]
MNFGTQIESKFPTLLTSEKTKRYVDVTFYIGPNRKIFYGHRLLFAVSSPFWKKVFFSRGWKKRREEVSEVILTDLSPDLFRILYNYIYKRKITLNNENYLKIYDLAERFQMEDLKNVCTSFLVNSIKPTNALDALDDPKIFKIPQFKKQIIIFITHNLTKVFVSYDCLNKLKTSTIRYLLRSVKSLLSLKIQFNCIRNRAYYLATYLGLEINPQELFPYIKELLACLDFTDCSKEQIQEILNSKLVTKSYLDTLLKENQKLSSAKTKTNENGNEKENENVNENEKEKNKQPNSNRIEIEIGVGENKNVPIQKTNYRKHENVTGKQNVKSTDQQNNKIPTFVYVSSSAKSILNSIQKIVKLSPAIDCKLLSSSIPELVHLKKYKSLLIQAHSKNIISEEYGDRVMKYLECTDGNVVVLYHGTAKISIDQLFPRSLNKRWIPIEDKRYRQGQYANRQNHGLIKIATEVPLNNTQKLNPLFNGINNQNFGRCAYHTDIFTKNLPKNSHLTIQTILETEEKVPLILTSKRKNYQGTLIFCNFWPLNERNNINFNKSVNNWNLLIINAIISNYQN